MAGQLTSILLPLNGELSVLGTYKKYHQNGQSPIFSRFDVLPVLDEDDPLLYPKPKENFNLYDFIFDEKNDEPFKDKQLAIDRSNSFDLNCDIVNFLENLKKEGFDNLLDLPSNSEKLIEPFDENSCLHNQLQVIGDNSSEALSLYQCVDDLYKYDLGCLNRNCISPDNDSDSGNSIDNSMYFDYQLSPFAEVESLNEIQDVSINNYLSPNNNSTYDSDSNSSIENLLFEEIHPPQQILRKHINEISIDFPDNSKPIRNNETKFRLHPDKKARKKQQNRESALRYREKKRKETTNVDVELKALEEKHEYLLSKVEETKSEIAYLKNFLSDIICVDA